VTGWAKRPTRAFTTALLVYMALEAPRIIGSEELRRVFAKNEDLKARAIWNRVNELREAIGPERIVREGGGYRFVGEIVCDWTSFKVFVDDARAAEGAERERLLRSALELGRGAPFEDAHAAMLEWAASSRRIKRISTAVADAAHELSAALLAEKRFDEAEQAARDGLRADRNSEVLVEDMILAAEVSKVRYAQAWKEAAELLGEDDSRLAELRAKFDGPRHT
jgi:hypothetical protein